VKTTLRSSRAASVIFFLCIGFALSAATVGGNEAWRILERAQIAFERGEAGEALLFCEQAREVHTAGIRSYIEILKKSLAPAEVKKAGDDIRDVQAVLEKRNDSPALAVFEAVPDFFGKSVAAMLAWLEKRLVYPEADFLVGKVYEAEGEHRLALSFYEKAWSNRDMLDIGDEQYTLIYRMADLSANMQNFGAQEAYLLLILTEDPVFGKPGEESPTLRAMIRTLEIERTTDKFFSLYRHSNFTAYKAYLDLSHFYYYDSRKRLDRALVRLSVRISNMCTAVSATFLPAWAKMRNLPHGRGTTVSGIPFWCWPPFSTTTVRVLRRCICGPWSPTTARTALPPVGRR